MDDENKMTLDELCYKNLKVFFIRIKENNGDFGEIQKESLNENKNSIIEKKIFKNIFKNNENFDNWIIFGKERSGKTTFINCLLNYINGIKYEDNFRYIIQGQKRTGYEIFDIQGNSQKIKVIEFSGFSGDLEKDNQINKNIKKFIKELKEVKLIAFVISGNETRLTDDLKNIFSNIWDIFAIDIKSNFIFIATNCDERQPPVLDCIKDSHLSKLLFNSKDKMIFKFNNSYLYEINQKDFWNIGISHYDELMSVINQKDNITLNLTKCIIDFKFDKTYSIFVDSLFRLINLKYYFNILKNINSYDYKYNIEIPFDYYEMEKICANCNRKMIQNPCKFCSSTKYKSQRKIITLQIIKKNNKLYSECFNKYNNLTKEQFINTALQYKQLKDYYNSKLIQITSLQNDLKEMIDKNDKNKKILCQEINQQENQLNTFLVGNFQYDYKSYLLSNFDILLKNN